MTLRKLTAFVALSLLLTSCQQEVDDEILPDPGNGNGGGGGSVPGTSRIIKAVGVTGQDTLTTFYTYDAQGRMETLSTHGTNGGQPVHIFKKWYYDANRIVKMASLSESGGFPGDTSFTAVHYPNAATLEFDYTVTKTDLLGIQNIDSTRFTYLNGQLRMGSSYLSVFGLDSYLAARNTYTYNASGNVSSIKMEGSTDFTGNTPLELLGTQTLSYGSSWSEVWSLPNPAQRFLMAGLPNQGNEGVTLLVTNTVQGPSSTISTSYSSGAASRPTSAVITQNVAGQVLVTKYSFYYQ